ncbi:MAG TPA: hypothetical protein VGM51_08410 [Armatimonadota bacterium]|jgi:hypothetical protein
MVIGEGSHRYEWDGAWAKLPDGVALGFTHGVVTDRQDNVYVFNQSKDAMCVFDREGRFMRSWGEQFAKGAHGLFLTPEGDDEFLILCDYELSAVFKTTLNGEVVWTITAPPLPEVYQTPDMFFPTDACVAPNGDVYVFDGYGQGWVHQYTHDARYIRSWDGSAGAAGKMQCPHGGWVDTRGPEPLLMVADRGNNRIQVFGLDGGYHSVITDELRFPCCFYQDGGEMIVPDLHARVSIFDERNRLITHLGDTPGAWDHPNWPDIPHAERHDGHFLTPHAACVDSRGDMYVVEFIPDGRLTKLIRW